MFGSYCIFKMLKIQHIHYTVNLNQAHLAPDIWGRVSANIYSIMYIHYISGAAKQQGLNLKN